MADRYDKRDLVKKPPPPEGRTVADEQRERSAEIDRAGMEKWKAERDERSEEDKQPRQVEGLW